MRTGRILCTLVLILSCAVFVYFSRNYYRQQDTLGPVIDMDDSVIYVSVNDPQSQVMDGISAYDSKDGNVTDLVLVEQISDFVEKDTRIVSYAAFDRDNHVTKAQRRMVYTDYVSPHFSLSAPLRFAATSSSVNYLRNLSAWDCLDGDLSDRISFAAGSVINTDTPSDYKISISVTNSAGDTAVLPVTLTVYNSTFESMAPTIELTDYLMYTEIGQKLDPSLYLADVVYRGTVYNLTDEEGTFGVDTEGWSRSALEEFRDREPAVNRSRISINDMVNYQAPGTYEIQYILTDPEGNTGKAALIVVVEETE